MDGWSTKQHVVIAVVALLLFNVVIESFFVYFPIPLSFAAIGCSVVMQAFPN